MYRSARLRREAERREAQVLEALFAARKSGSGGAGIDVDRIFGGTPSSATTSADAVLRAAGLQSEVIALLTRKDELAAAPALSTEVATPVAAEPVERPPVDGTTDREAVPPPRAGTAEAETPAPVRDLVQILYEGRGFRATPADPSARPIELVLTHRSDARRSYAFVPLAGAPSEGDARSMIASARRIDQLRVLIAAEGAVPQPLAEVLLPQGVRVFDRTAIEAQLARLDAELAAKIRLLARRRAEQRQQAA